MRVTSGWSLSLQLRMQGRTRFWTELHSITVHPHTNTHIHSFWDNLDTPVNPICISLESEGKLEYPKETHADIGNNTKSTHSSPSQQSGFFSHQCHDEIILNKTLFKDLLYSKMGTLFKKTQEVFKSERGIRRIF